MAALVVASGFCNGNIILEAMIGIELERFTVKRSAHDIVYTSHAVDL